jgi:hypothetical protein
MQRRVQGIQAPVPVALFTCQASSACTQAASATDTALPLLPVLVNPPVPDRAPAHCDHSYCIGTEMRSTCTLLSMRRGLLENSRYGTSFLGGGGEKGGGGGGGGSPHKTFLPSREHAWESHASESTHVCCSCIWCYVCAEPAGRCSLTFPMSRTVMHACRVPAINTPYLLHICAAPTRICLCTSDPPLDILLQFWKFCMHRQCLTSKKHTGSTHADALSMPSLQSQQCQCPVWLWYEVSEIKWMRPGAWQDAGGACSHAFCAVRCQLREVSSVQTGAGAPRMAAVTPAACCGASGVRREGCFVPARGPRSPEEQLDCWPVAEPQRAQSVDRQRRVLSRRAPSLLQLLGTFPAAACRRPRSAPSLLQLRGGFCCWGERLASDMRGMTATLPPCARLCARVGGSARGGLAAGCGGVLPFRTSLVRCSCAACCRSAGSCSSCVAVGRCWGSTAKHWSSTLASSSLHTTACRCEWTPQHPSVAGFHSMPMSEGSTACRCEKIPQHASVGGHPAGQSLQRACTDVPLFARAVSRPQPALGRPQMLQVQVQFPTAAG